GVIGNLRCFNVLKVPGLALVLTPDFEMKIEEGHKADGGILKGEGVSKWLWLHVEAGDRGGWRNAGSRIYADGNDRQMRGGQAPATPPLRGAGSRDHTGSSGPGIRRPGPSPRGPRGLNRASRPSETHHAGARRNRAGGIQIRGSWAGHL